MAYTIPQIPATYELPAADDYAESGGATRGSGKTLLQLLTRKVASVAALKALSVASVADGLTVHVLGYYAANDGGGGVFVYNAASGATDNGGTILQPTVGVGRWLRVFDGDTVCADWFGCKGDGVTDDRTNMQKALDWASTQSRATVLLNAKTYALSDFLTLNANYVSLIGKGQQYTRFLLTGAAVDFLRVGQIAGPSIAIPTLAAFAVGRNQNATGGTGISLIKTAQAKLFDLHIDGCQNGVYMSAATNSMLTRVLCSCGPTATNFVGFTFDGGQTGSTILPAASSRMDNCVVDASSCSGTSLGVKISGNGIADIYSTYFGCLRCSYGVYIDGARAVLLTPSYNWDIQFFLTTVDEFKTQGIYVANNTKTGQITFNGVWTNPSSTAGIGSGIYIQNSRGVRIIGAQLMNIGQYATSRGVTFEASQNCEFSGDCIDLNYGAYLLNAANCAISDARIYNQSTRTGATGILVSGASRNRITNNTIDGYNAVGIADDAGSSKNIYAENVIVPTNITTATTLVGTGNVVANNVTT